MFFFMFLTGGFRGQVCHFDAEMNLPKFNCKTDCQSMLLKIIFSADFIFRILALSANFALQNA